MEVEYRTNLCSHHGVQQRERIKNMDSEQHDIFY